MQITFGISGNSAKSRDGEFLGFVFTCPSCHTPVSYQAREDSAVELDKKTFENFQRAMEKRISEAERRGMAFSRRSALKTTGKTIDEGIFSDMLRDIRESESYDDFLRRIEK
jgi:hypothetical protein